MTAPTWTQLAPAFSPPAREFFCMALDESRNVVVLYGGWLDIAHTAYDYTHTYEWDGANWANIATAHHPAALPPGGNNAYSTMIWDGCTGKMMLYGAQIIAGVCSNHIWLYDGTDWVESLPAHRPDPMLTGGLGYDPTTNRTYFQNGKGISFTCDPTHQMWVWDGIDWTAIDPGDPPDFAFGFHAQMFTWEPNLATMIWNDAAAADPSTTDAWDGAAWTQLLSTGTSPENRSNDDESGVAPNLRGYVPNCGGLVTYVGNYPGDSFASRTIKLDPGIPQWQDLSPASDPGAIGGFACCTDPTGRLMLFGGHDSYSSPTTVLANTWVFDCVPLTTPSLNTEFSL